MPKIMFVAGENSGDMHAARVISELRRVLPEAEVFGYGGERMEAAGMRLDVNLAQKFPVIGLTQAIRSYPRLKKLLSRAVVTAKEEGADAVVLVDYPGFNLRLARAIKPLGIPVIYYISPQVWAWHKSRVQMISETVNRMLVILPFEEQLYRNAGIRVDYVGHPLQDGIEQQPSREEARELIGIEPGKRVVGLLPGSRNGEVIRHLPMLLGAARIIREKIPDIEFLLPVAGTIDSGLIRKYLARVPEIVVRTHSGPAATAMAAMDFAICKSGTSTLELAIAGVGMVIIYKVSLPTYIMAKLVVKIPWIGLVNIVADECIAPELIQQKANARDVAETALRYLTDDELMRKMQSDLARVRSKIGGSGASRRAAEAIAETIRQVTSRTRPAGQTESAL